CQTGGSSALYLFAFLRFSYTVSRLLSAFYANFMIFLKGSITNDKGMFGSRALVVLRLPNGRHLTKSVSTRSRRPGGD
uniref:Uncharacterized protein n=1 Tax=Oryza brachyantha TaxID=4533 RepID=J3M2D5_ORYBR